MGREILRLREHPDWLERAADWFHAKWGVPREAYAESMAACLAGGGPVPQWYMLVEDDAILAGLGVIENDFHDRPDLTPNVCAVFVEPAYRRQGLAGELLRHVCADFADFGVDTLYLVTDHTGFYERYGWEFLCLVRDGDGPELTRMYVHREK